MICSEGHSPEIMQRYLDRQGKGFIHVCPRSDEHPTMKPIELVARAIGNSSNKGDIVLDLFGGSGSTLIACEQTGRKCRMMELDPRYCDVIVDRWQKFTGKTAELVRS